MIIELAKNRIKSIMHRKGYKFFDKGNYNLNIIGIRSDVKIANRGNDFFLAKGVIVPGIVIGPA